MAVNPIWGNLLTNQAKHLELLPRVTLVPKSCAHPKWAKSEKTFTPIYEINIQIPNFEKPSPSPKRTPTWQSGCGRIGRSWSSGVCSSCINWNILPPLEPPRFFFCSFLFFPSTSAPLESVRNKGSLPVSPTTTTTCCPCGTLRWHFQNNPGSR